MQLLRTVDAVQGVAKRLEEKTLALVPTMGGLHEGHLALVRHARTIADTVMVSIYVNPLQFGGNEDFSTYPRRLQEDCCKLEGLADIVYAPDDSQMYPCSQTVGISLPPMADRFCGASRPGFFQGVTAVVCKLFNQCRPHCAVFGRKDYQQALLVRQMSAQLDMQIKIILHPTVRNDDGLALSSRNEYLTDKEKSQAAMLYQTLKAMAQRLQAGDYDFDRICAEARRQLTDIGFKIDYLVIRAADDLGEPVPDGANTVLAAAWLGKARLIDNITVYPDGAAI